MDGVATKATEACSEENSVEEEWSAIRSAMVETAREVLGYEEKYHQPDWFRESEENLSPLFQERNQLYIPEVAKH